MNARPTRARLHSLCGTARRIASQKSESDPKRAQRQPCRYAAIWACQKSADCAQRMDAQRAEPRR